MVPPLSIPYCYCYHYCYYNQFWVSTVLKHGEDNPLGLYCNCKSNWYFRDYIIKLFFSQDFLNWNITKGCFGFFFQMRKSRDQKCRKYNNFSLCRFKITCYKLIWNKKMVFLIIDRLCNIALCGIYKTHKHWIELSLLLKSFLTENT